MFNRKKTFVIPLLLFCLTTGACGSNAAETSGSVTLTPPEISTESYNFAEAYSGQIFSEYIFDNCELYCQDSINIHSNISGEIVSLSYGLNQKINSGDILMTVRVDYSETQIAEAEIAYDQAYRAYLAEKREKEIEIEEFEALIEALPETSLEKLDKLEELEQMNKDYDNYVSRQITSLNNSLSSIEGMKSSTGIYYVYASCDGYLTNVVSKRAGDTVNYGEQIATIVSSLDRLIEVDDSRKQLRYGMRVTISNKYSDNLSLTGTVVSASDVLPESLWTGKSYVKPDTDFGTDNWSGYIVRATLKDISNLCMINSKALYADNARRYVQIYKDGVVTKQYVNFATSSSGASWILNGINIGDQLVMKTTGRR